MPISESERMAIPQEDCAGPDHTFYVRDQNDFNNAVADLGFSHNKDAVKSRLIEIAKRKGLKLPESWQSGGKPTFSLVGGACFSAEEIVMQGKIFECGDYPEKNFSLSETEADSVTIASFSPVNNELEHVNSYGTRTILDGKLGRLEKVWRDGKNLFGRMTVPKWLYECVDNKQIALSLAFDKDKKISATGLVIEGHLPDTNALAAAFSASTSAPMPPDSSLRINGDMDVIQSIKALLAGDAGAAQPAQPEPSTPPANAATFNSADPKLIERLTALETENASLKEAQRNQATSALVQASVAFAKSQVEKGKAYPSENEANAKLYLNAVTDDNAAKPTCFSADGTISTGERVKDLLASFEARPIIKDNLDYSATFSLIPNTPQSGDAIDQAEIDRLLDMTPLGSSVKAGRK